MCSDLLYPTTSNRRFIPASGLEIGLAFVATFALFGGVSVGLDPSANNKFGIGMLSAAGACALMMFLCCCIKRRAKSQAEQSSNNGACDMEPPELEGDGDNPAP